MKSATSNVLHILWWDCFILSEGKYVAPVKSRCSSSGSLCQRWVTDDLMVLCPVCCVYNVLADISNPLGERSTSYLQSDGTRKGERARKARCRPGEEKGWTSKGRDAKYTHPFLALHVHLYLTVWASREEAEPSTCNWFTPLRGSWHRNASAVRCLLA